ncbi:class I SAM-dependent methyltransferase [Verrucosispora sp. ts21]|uniref:class I SAM-dependent methyltransferase n=1 Tax=Verrucosispora sp. ts21 TaxID=2069341 RepID=UPI0011AFB1D0|nr:class I SAM-dependent methyltransferase [Verrucosispora sp. ts21]
MTTTAYQFRNAPAQLGPLQQVLDPITRHDLAKIPIRPGWRALDVGAGAGSITRHLADTVGPTGAVIAVDLDTGLLDPTNIIDVYRRDLRHGLDLPIAPGSLDLIHARCVLEHLDNRTDLLRQMTALLRPGGWLAVGEIVYSRPVIHRAPADDDGDLIHRVIHAILDILSDGGTDLDWGNRVHAHLLDAGMTHVHSLTRADTWTGGGPGCLLLADNAHQLHDRLLPATDLEDADLTRFGELMTDPGVALRGYQFTSTLARKPESPLGAEQRPKPPGRSRQPQGRNGDSNDPLRRETGQTDLRTAATPQATRKVTAISPIRSQGTSRVGRTPIDTANASCASRARQMTTLSAR